MEMLMMIILQIFSKKAMKIILNIKEMLAIG